MIALGIQFADLCRIEKTQAGIRRRDQNAVRNGRANVPADPTQKPRSNSDFARRAISSRSFNSDIASCQPCQRLFKEIRCTEVPRL